MPSWQKMPKKRKTLMQDALAIEVMTAAGARLGALRQLAGLTHAQVASLIEVDPSNWTRWERGERMPELMAMLRFCARFKTTLAFIYQGFPDGSHPDLVRHLLAQAPHLLAPHTMRSAPDTDSYRASYIASIQRH